MNISPKEGSMRFRISALMLLSAFAVLPVLLTAAEKGDPAAGKQVYSRCSVCHGESGEGNQSIGKALGVTLPKLGSREVQSLDDAALKKVITEGKGKMRPINLSDKELADVIAYLRTLKKP